MNNDDEISRYVRRVRSALRLPRQQRRRAVEEIRNHLDDGAAAHILEGVPRQQAVALAISEAGQPDVVAAEFNDGAAQGSDAAGLRRWLPLLPPLLLFVVATGLMVWSVVWIADGWTDGEQAAQRRYLLSVFTFGALSCGAYLSIMRGQSDRTWRWGAWACAGLALLTVVLPF